jgi:hypothetical protein
MPQQDRELYELKSALSMMARETDEDDEEIADQLLKHYAEQGATPPMDFDEMSAYVRAERDKAGEWG